MTKYDDWKDKDEQIKQLKEELEYYKKNSVMICGMGTEDDDGEEAEELGVEEQKIFLILMKRVLLMIFISIKMCIKYDRVFRNGEEV